jgi:hypothetical protein
MARYADLSEEQKARYRAKCLERYHAKMASLSPRQLKAERKRQRDYQAKYRAAHKEELNQRGRKWYAEYKELKALVPELKTEIETLRSQLKEVQSA